MAKSSISIVDDNDRPVGAATKVEAWASGLKHRLVHILIEDMGGRLLLQKRSSEMELWPDCWTASASGHVDAGESYLAAAERETVEELGVKIPLKLEEIGDFYWSGEFADKKLNRFNKVYRTSIDPSKITFQLQASEVTETRWFTIDEVMELIQKHPDYITHDLIIIVKRFY